MGWENRKGRQVYIRKKRIGKRVVSEYVGAGEAAQLMAMYDMHESREAKRKRHAWRKVIEDEARINSLMHDAGRIVKAITDATLVTNGYRRHKGQWRKARKGAKQDE